MNYEKLHNRYGAHVASRVHAALTGPEFEKVSLDELPEWLDSRAELAHKHYQICLANPFTTDETGADRGQQIDALYKRWQDADELSYLVAIAEDVTHARAAAGAHR
jgi:hypothetical protein